MFVNRVRFATAKNDGVNVVYWETNKGEKRYITLSLEWYNETGLSPVDAMSIYAGINVHPSVKVEDFNPMYEVPRQASCLNTSNSPYEPYVHVLDNLKIENNADLGNH